MTSDDFERFKKCVSDGGGVIRFVNTESAHGGGIRVRRVDVEGNDDLIRDIKAKAYLEIFYGLATLDAPSLGF